MTQLENKVSRYRKVTEMIYELNEIVESLKAEKTQLGDELMAGFKKSDFNVCQYKTLSVGLVGRNLFNVSFSQRIDRKSGKRLDDQTWLAKIHGDTGPLGIEFVGANLVLQKDAIKAAWRQTPDAVEKWMDAYDLTFRKTMSLNVRRIPSDTELSAIRAEAEKMVGEYEAAV